MLRGITSAAAVFITAAIGVVAGAGYLWLAVAVTVFALLSLELRYLPVVRLLDARRYADRFAGDDDPPRPARRPPPGP